MNFNSFFIYFFSFFLALAIIRIIQLIIAKQVKSKQFVLWLVAAILFAVNVFVHMQNNA